MRSSPFFHTLKEAKTLLQESALEAFWPTRCAICDRPGTLLCEQCRRGLPYIDQCMSCPTCGGPFGSVQCTECNPIMLAAAGMEKVPFLSCASLTTFDDQVKRVVIAFKDQGEQRMATPMARMMSSLINPSWGPSIDAITYVPASTAALRRRGFDHGFLLANSLSQFVGKPCLGLLARPSAMDQRELGRKGRIKNMSEALRPNSAAQGRMPAKILLIDDVTTTGSTLYAATNALLEGGAQEVRCITFARAW